MYISYLYVQTVTHQCFCFPNSQWDATAHDICENIGNNIKFNCRKTGSLLVLKLIATNKILWNKHFNN